METDFELRNWNYLFGFYFSHFWIEQSYIDNHAHMDTYTSQSMYKKQREQVFWNNFILNTFYWFTYLTTIL